MVPVEIGTGRFVLPSHNRPISWLDSPLATPTAGMLEGPRSRGDGPAPESCVVQVWAAPHLGRSRPWGRLCSPMWGCARLGQAMLSRCGPFTAADPWHTLTGALQMAESGVGGQVQVPVRSLCVMAIQPLVFSPLKWELMYCEVLRAAPLRHTPQALWSPRLFLVTYASAFLVSLLPARARLHAPCSLPVPVALLTRAVSLQMSNITVTYRDGRVAQLEQVYIRGSKIRFLILPDMLKNAPMLKSMKNKNQGSGAGRGKAAILKAQGRCCGPRAVADRHVVAF